MKTLDSILIIGFIALTIMACLNIEAYVRLISLL